MWVIHLYCAIDCARKKRLKKCQIPNFPRVPESRVVGEHFELLFGSGTRDLAELWRTKTRMSWLSFLVSLYRISLRNPSSR